MGNYRTSFNKCFKMSLWLRIKFYWYKYIRRLDIIGFFDGVPMVRTKYLEEENPYTEEHRIAATKAFYELLKARLGRE